VLRIAPDNAAGCAVTRAAGFEPMDDPVVWESRGWCTELLTWCQRHRASLTP
jgi:hypothetical protein